MTLEQLINETAGIVNQLNDSFLVFISLPITAYMIFSAYTFITSVRIELPKQKVIVFTGGIFKKETNSLICSECSAYHDMNDIKPKLDRKNSFKCSCGVDLCHLTLE